MKVFIINTLFFWTPYSYLLASSSSIKPFNQQVYIKNWLFQHYFEFRGEWDGRNWLDIAYLFLINPLQCYLNWVSLSCFILLSSQKQEVLCALCCLCRISPLASTISSDFANVTGAAGQERPFIIHLWCCLWRQIFAINEVNSD